MLENWLPTCSKARRTVPAMRRALRLGRAPSSRTRTPEPFCCSRRRRRGMQARAIKSKLTAMGKDERAINVSGYVHRGNVKYS